MQHLPHAPFCCCKPVVFFYVGVVVTEGCAPSLFAEQGSWFGPMDLLFGERRAERTT